MLGKILDGRVPTFWNNLKSNAEQVVVSHFNLRASCAEEVDWYTSKMQYVYPCDAKTGKVETRCPYQNMSIVSTILIFYMTRHADIMDAHADQFKPSEEESMDRELPDAMITSAATADYAALTEWWSGHRQQTDFSANTFSSVYSAHITLLAVIKRENPRGYHLLKAKLYKMVMEMVHSSTSQMRDEATGLLDVHAIDID